MKLWADDMNKALYAVNMHLEYTNVNNTWIVARNHRGQLPDTTRQKKGSEAYSFEFLIDQYIIKLHSYISQF